MHKARYVAERGNNRPSRNAYRVKQRCFFDSYYIIFPGSICSCNIGTGKYAAAADYANLIKIRLVKLDTVHPVDRAPGRPSHAISIIGGAGTDLKGPGRSSIRGEENKVAPAGTELVVPVHATGRNDYSIHISGVYTYS